MERRGVLDNTYCCCQPQHGHTPFGRWVWTERCKI
jgi:hypothetical protein